MSYCSSFFRFVLSFNVLHTACACYRSLGFGIAAQSTATVKELDPTANVVLHQCDVGEYLRFEDEMFN